MILECLTVWAVSPSTNRGDSVKQATEASMK